MTQDEYEKQSKEFRKIILRFFKEAGLYKYWKEYIRFEECSNSFPGLPKPFRDNWFKAKYIDNILGRTRFTTFLRNKKGIYLPVNTVYIFRYYLYCIYGNKYSFGHGNFDVLDCNNLVKVDKQTKNITIKYNDNIF